MAVIRSTDSTSLYEAAMQIAVSKNEAKRLQYWIESVEQALDRHHWLLGPGTCRLIAKDMQAAHDNYGMAFPGYEGY